MEVVNGYVCRNCTDVSYAKKFVDPAHPKDGPNGRDARAAEAAAQSHGPAVLFGNGLGQAPAANGVEAVRPAGATSGAAVDLKV